MTDPPSEMGADFSTTFSTTLWLEIVYFSHLELYF